MTSVKNFPAYSNRCDRARISVTIRSESRRKGQHQSWTWVGSVHGSGRVGLGPDFSLLSGLGRVGSICVGLCGSPWIIQNVTLSVIVKFTQFSELLVLLKLFSV